MSRFNGKHGMCNQLRICDARKILNFELDLLILDSLFVSALYFHVYTSPFARKTLISNHVILV